MMGKLEGGQIRMGMFGGVANIPVAVVVWNLGADGVCFPR
jgi:hypothetical protein